jgi:hypothetical protein
MDCDLLETDVDEAVDFTTSRAAAAFDEGVAPEV